MSLRRVKGVGEHVDWERQAVREVDDRRECLELELEDLPKFPAPLDPLEEGVKDVLGSMEEGTQSLGREDPPFLDLAGKYSDQIPFHALRKQINETRPRVLAVDRDDN
jgi:hypothetical protein